MRYGCIGEPFHPENREKWKKLDEVARHNGRAISVVRLGMVCYKILDELADDIEIPAHIDETGKPSPVEERRVIKRLILEIG